MANYDASFRLVLMVKKEVRGEDFPTAVANAEALNITDLLKGNLLKCEVQDWGMHLAMVEEEDQYNTE